MKMIPFLLQTMRLFIFLLIFAGHSSAFAEKTPMQVLSAMRESAQKGAFEATWKHTVKVKDIPAQAEEQLKGKIRKIIKLFSRGWNFDIKEERIVGDCAVIIVNESKKSGKASFDLDPVYLFKQNGEWKVFPDLSDWDLIEYIDKEEVETFKKLEKWYRKRETVLRKNK